MLDLFKDFVNTLHADQIVALINLLGWDIISHLFNIFTILFSEYLIKQFNLETKFPKFSKWINLRRKISYHLIYWFVFWLIIFILVMVSCDIYIIFFARG